VDTDTPADLRSGVAVCHGESPNLPTDDATAATVGPGDDVTTPAAPTPRSRRARPARPPRVSDFLGSRTATELDRAGQREAHAQDVRSGEALAGLAAALVGGAPPRSAGG